MNVEIPKIGEFENVSGAPAWCPVKTSDGKPVKPVIRCNCGAFCGIGLHHVHADGTVTASFLHGKADFTHKGKRYHGDPKGCEWHVFLKLLDYDQGEFLPED